MAAVNKADLVIVGGGLSGLALAYYLQDKCKVVLLEARPRLGGVVCSQRKDKYLLEYGPNTTRTTPELEELLSSLALNEEVITAGVASKKRYLVAKTKRGKEILATPSGFLDALRTPLLSSGEKLRILKEPFISSKTTVGESVDCFVSRRFGSAVSQKLVAAILSGIWAGDITKMEAASALPFLVSAEQSSGSVIRSLFKKKGEKSQKPKIISFQAGMSTLVEGLASKLNRTTIITNANVQGLELGADEAVVRFDDQKLTASRVVLTQNATAVAHLLQPINQGIAQQIAAIAYSQLGIVHLAFKRSAVLQPIDGFGFLVPPIYGDGLLGCIFNSAIFPDRAPEDEVLLTAFVGGATVAERADVTQEDNRQHVIQSVKKLLQITAEPTFVETTHLIHAIPNYNIGHQKIIREVEAFCEERKSIDILANWQRQISVAERITAAKSLAEKLLS